MFSYLAAALGNCALITEEDSGTFFDTIGTLTRPDFRLITRDNQQMLIEVKNHHEKNVPQPYSFTESYLESVTRYAELMGLPLKFAIYWSRWNTWTLTDASRLSQKGGKIQLTFPDALKMNEMATLGDISGRNRSSAGAPLLCRHHQTPRGQRRRRSPLHDRKGLLVLWRQGNHQTG